MFEWYKKESPILSLLGVGGGAGGNLAGGAAAGPGSVVASGGAVQEYTDPAGPTTYRLHIFANSNADFVYTSGPGLVDVMVMGGGGSGGGAYGDQDAGKGGGGAGGLAWASQIPIAEGTTCGVVVGTGGNGHYGSRQDANRVGYNGTDSAFSIPSGPYTITGRGGGGGGATDTGTAPVGPQRSPSTNTNSGAPGGSGGGSGARGSGDGNYNGGPATQPAANPSMPWVTDYGYAGASSGSSPSTGGGGGGGTAAAGNDVSSSNGGPGGVGRQNFVGPTAKQKLFFLGTKGLGMSNTNPHEYASPSNPAVYFGGGGAGAPGTSGSDFSVPLARGGLGGGGRAGLGRNVQQSGPLSSTLPSAYWYEIGGANHHGGGGGAGADDPAGPGSKRTSAGFSGRGGMGVVVVRYEYTPGTNDTFVAATGGTTSTDGDYKVHKFDGSGTSNTTNNFTVTQKAGDPKDNTIEVLVVGGGGSGGKWSGGGGGAGGVAHTYNYPLDHPSFPNAGGPWVIPLQAGGGGASQSSNGVGNVGGDSFFGPSGLRVYALGGGGGGTSRDQPDRPATTFQSMDGGSGGGGTGQDRNIRAGFGHQRDIFGNSPQTTLFSNKLECNERTVIYNYGNAGGQSPSDSSADMGGGGGAGGTGTDGGPGSGYSAGNGHGGPGIAISITGSPVVYGGGGTAASPPGSESGAPGGGGQGGGSSAGGAGTDGLGGGGGGTYSGGPQSGQGGAGTVIVRYKYQ